MTYNSVQELRTRTGSLTVLIPMLCISAKSPSLMKLYQGQSAIYTGKPTSTAGCVPGTMTRVSQNCSLCSLVQCFASVSSSLCLVSALHSLK